MGWHRHCLQTEKRKHGTLIVVWTVGHIAPWVLLTDLAPDAVGVLWYGLRVWIELGFRVRKSLGWQWQQTHRRDPGRNGTALARASDCYGVDGGRGHTG